MIESVTTTTEEVKLVEVRNDVEYSILVTIDYKNKMWTISKNEQNERFSYKNTRDYDAGIATANLIKEATYIAWQRLGLAYDQVYELESPF